MLFLSNLRDLEVLSIIADSISPWIINSVRLLMKVSLDCTKKNISIELTDSLTGVVTF